MDVNHYFGDPDWTRDRSTIKVPIGLPCAECDEMISEEDSGVVMQQTEIDPDLGRDRVVGKQGDFLLVSYPSQLVQVHSVALHIECFIRMIVGSIGHQMGLCTCFGGPGKMDDPPDVSKHEAARAAYLHYLSKRLVTETGARKLFILRQMVRCGAARHLVKQLSLAQREERGLDN